MQITSAEYKAEQKRDLRNESHVFVYLGVINKEAQYNAYIDPNITDLEPYSTLTIFQEAEFEAYYASLEENYTKADGSMMFLPEDATAYALFQGAVTADIEGDITFYFKEYNQLRIKGLTIDFGEYYPTEFTVSNGDDTYTYTNDEPGVYVLEDVFTDTDHITVTPISMVGGQQRMRILSMMFGVGLRFDNSTLVSTQRTNTVDHLSNSLPKKQFSFTVSNIGKKFNKDNPYSFINFLETGQACSYEYGRTMDDGTIERIDGGDVALKTWSSNDTQAKFVCVGYLDYMNGTFYKGQYRPNGISAYDLAVEVFEDAGIENYRIDTYLERITLYNPLPLTTHKNCLQLIANATQSILYEDRQGTVVIESSFTPEITSVVYQGASDFSDTETIITEEGSSTNYASLERLYNKVDGTLKFLPEDVSAALPVGFVSNRVALASTNPEENGIYDPEASITITWEAQWTFYGILLTYTPWAMPTQITAIGYADNVEVIRETTTNVTALSSRFNEVDKVKIIFDKGTTIQRVHCKTIQIGDVTDYEITYHDLSATPIATSMDHVKAVDVHFFNFFYGDESQNVATSIVSDGDNLITFSQPYHDYSVVYTSGSGTVTVKESGAYYTLIEASRAGEIQITGKKIEMADNTYTYGVGELGTTKTVNNQLISTEELAALEGEWVGEYYNSATEYSITFRGEPALDCDDLIYLENKFVPKNLIRITSETLDTGTGMAPNAHKLKATRVSYSS